MTTKQTPQEKLQAMIDAAENPDIDEMKWLIARVKQLEESLESIKEFDIATHKDGIIEERCIEALHTDPLSKEGE